MLGGGGFTGGVYEIGALRALDLLAVNRTVNEFDVYVGTSAGSFVASMLANGVTPEEMMRVAEPAPAVRRSGTWTRGRCCDPTTAASPPARRCFPLRLAGRRARARRADLGDVSVMDVLAGLSAALPTGLYDGRGIERYVEEVLADPDRTERLPACSSTSCTSPPPTSTRPSASSSARASGPTCRSRARSRRRPRCRWSTRRSSCAGRQFVDGGIRSTTNVDVAVERGAKFIVVVNPLVPFVNDFSKRDPDRVRDPRRAASPTWASPRSATRPSGSSPTTASTARSRTGAQSYPGVDIILIEPEPDDELMFGTSILDYSARLRIAKHGFESVTLRLARDYDRYKQIAERHGIEISARRVRHVLDQVEREREETSAWRRVLEQTTGALLRQTRHPTSSVSPRTAPRSAARTSRRRRCA